MARRRRRSGRRDVWLCNERVRERGRVRIVEERENYLLLTDGARFAVAERRAGKLYAVRDGTRHGAPMEDEAAVAAAIGPDEWQEETAARQTLNELVTRRSELAERLR